VWAENNARYRYARKAEIDSAIQTYQSQNSITGISVAIVRDGQMIYRRGFGWAERDAQKQAHGETVYLTASVSKVVGGTLAARLEDVGRLRDGTQVQLALDNRTSRYLTRLPAAHSHTVRQLLSHLGCIWHYSTGPTPSGHYSWARDAAERMWDTPPLRNCTIGTDRNYSTHGFTFVGAVLEQVTGRPITRLIREEIAAPFGLGSLRVQFEGTALPSNYERAQPYTDDGRETRYDDNSWKVLGGGIEINGVDLAEFGWRTLNAETVAAAARDNRLWTRVIAGQPNGLAWEVRTVGGRRVAEHGGSWQGARSHLRVYRDDGLSIAILSNQGDHSPSALATTIANVILRP
jgi:CubicO group peptidase (beta-lactamase class C family)